VSLTFIVKAASCLLFIFLFLASNCPIILYSQTIIVCTLPAGQGTALGLFVTVSSVSSNQVLFNYDAPIITSFGCSASVIAAGGPSTAGGASLTINGINFGLSATVQVGSSSCATTSITHTQLVCSLPAGQGTANSVSVTVGNQITVASSLFAYGKPVLSSVMPSKVDTGGGSVITIQGSNFGTSGTVFINSVSCDPSGAGFSHTSITCSVPAGQGSLVSFVVLVSGQNVTNSSFFGYLGPTISSISPSNGPTGGGVPITLSGSSFGLSTSPNLVYVGNSLCPIVPGSYTSARVVCTLPVGALTAYVTLIVVGASNATVQFAYDNPILSSVVPNTGLTQGGMSVMNCF
jgi:large repetitive protein